MSCRHVERPDQVGEIEMKVAVLLKVCQTEAARTLPSEAYEHADAIGNCKLGLIMHGIPVSVSTHHSISLSLYDIFPVTAWR